MSTQKTNTIVGFVSGVWNGTNGEIKRGQAKNGKKYAIAQINISEKKEDGTYVNGKPIKFVIFGPDADNVIERQRITLTGYFRPANYKKEGKEIRVSEFAATSAKPTVDGDKTSLWGYVTGVWVKNPGATDPKDGSFKIITGVANNGKKYTKAALKVSQKNQDGTYTNGENIPFTIWGDFDIVDKQLIEFEGFFKPNDFGDYKYKQIFFQVTKLISDNQQSQQEHVPEEPQEPNDIQEPQEPEPIDPTEQPPSSEPQSNNQQQIVEDEDENPFEDD